NGIRRKRYNRRQERSRQVARDVSANGLPDSLKRWSTSAIDAVEVTHTVLRHVRQLRQPSRTCSVLSVVDKTVENHQVISQAVSGRHPGFGRPTARGSFHAINVRAGNNLRSVDAAAVEVELKIGRHVFGGSVDGTRRPKEDVPVSVGSLS